MKVGDYATVAYYYLRSHDMVTAFLIFYHINRLSVETTPWTVLIDPS